MGATGLQRATTLVVVGLAAAVATSTIATSDETGYGDTQALCLVQNPLSSTIESWPDPGFDAPPVRDFGFTHQHFAQGTGGATISTTGEVTVTWTTVRGEHRAEPVETLSGQLEQNLIVQVAFACDGPLL